MQRKIVLTIAALLTFGLLAGAALAQGPGNGEGKGPPVFDAADITVLSSGDHGSPSAGFADADVIETLTLEAGDWKVTASGAAGLSSGGPSPNCGLLLDEDTLIAKQNFASEDDVNELGLSRSGFAVTGAALDVDDGAEVSLVCYGADVFEHNLVAIGGS